MYWGARKKEAPIPQYSLVFIALATLMIASTVASEVCWADYFSISLQGTGSIAKCPLTQSVTISMR